MSILIVSCSHRKQSNSRKISEFLKEKLKAQKKSVIWDLSEKPLPLWSEDLFQDGFFEGKEVLQEMKSLTRESEGLVFVSPEWGGMATPAAKNYLLLMSDRELFHKPVLLVSVSAGMGGAYPIGELRAFGFKNNFGCVVPDHLIFRHLKGFFESPDPAFLKRIDDTLSVFLRYCVALKEMRKDEIFQRKDLHVFGL